MTSAARRLGQLLVAVGLAGAAVMTGGAAADADPPRAWTGGVEADFGRVWWVHEGVLRGRPRQLAPRRPHHRGGRRRPHREPRRLELPRRRQAARPAPLAGPAHAVHDRRRDLRRAARPVGHRRLRPRDQPAAPLGDFREVDATGAAVGTVAIDVTLVGTGTPEKHRTYSAGRTRLEYEEYFPTAKAWGRFDGTASGARTSRRRQAGQLPDPRHGPRAVTPLSPRRA